MKKFEFRISREAEVFIRKTVLPENSGGEYVLTISPRTVADRLLVVNDSIEDSAEEYLKSKLTDLEEGRLELHWSVGASLRSRFPKEDIFTFSGIACFVPDELKTVLNGRTLLLVGKELRFEPELSPP